MRPLLGANIQTCRYAAARRYAPFPHASHVRLAILSCIRGCAASFCLWRCRRMAPSSRVAASLNVSLRQRPRSGRSLRSPRASSPASSRIAAALTHNASACHVRLAILSCIRGCAASFCLWRCRRMAPSSRVAASLNVSLRQRPRSGRSLRSPRASSPASSRIAVALTHNASACHARLPVFSCIRDGAASSCLWSV